MSNPTPILNNINAFDATKGTTISFNIIGGTDIVRSNIVYIYDLGTNDLICTHLYISTESIHELPPNTDPSIVYADGKSSADFVNNKNYYLQIQTFTNTAGTAGGSGMSVAKTFWCLFDPALSVNAIPAAISTTSYNVGATYTTNITDVTIPVTNIIQQYKFDLYTATGTLVQTSGNIIGSGEQEGTSTTYNITYNFSGLVVNNSYYVVVTTTSTEGMTVSAQSNTFTVSIDTPTVGGAIVNNNACDGYISVVSNLSDEYGGSASGEMASFETDSVNNVSSLKVNMEPIQDLHGYDAPWVGGAGKQLIPITESAEYTRSGATIKVDSGGIITFSGTAASAFSLTLAEFKLPAGTYAFSGYGSTAQSVGGNTYVYVRDTDNSATLYELTIGNTERRGTFTLSSETNIRFYIVCSTSNVVLSGQLKALLTLSSVTDTTYSPYSNICPISGHDSVDVEHTGKNLLDVSNLVRTGWNIGGIPNKLKPNTTYTYSVNGTTSYIYALFLATNGTNANSATTRLTTYIGAGNSVTFTTPSTMTEGWLVLAGGTSQAPNEDIGNILPQVELGTTATDYEPYQGQSYHQDIEATYTPTVQDNEPYLFKQTGDVYGDRESDKIVGGTVAWNQLVPTPSATQTINGVTFTVNADKSITVNGEATAQTEFFIGRVDYIANHKYAVLGIPSGASASTYWLRAIKGQRFSNAIDTLQVNDYWTTSIFVANGATVSNVTFRPNLFDLTAMFGSTIADYIYSLEQANAGAGVAWFKKLFPKPYYAYNAGELMSVNTSAHNTVGFNQWDEEWELGSIGTSDGQNTNSSTLIRSKNYVPVIPNATYYAKAPTSSGGNLFFYDADKNYLSYVGFAVNTNYTIPSNARYARFRMGSVYGATYNHDICINLSDPTRNGEYEPYQKHTYPLDSSLTLRGVPKLADGKLAFDGDVYPPSGEVQRRYGIVDLGTLNWAAGFGGFYTSRLYNVAKSPTDYYSPNAVCSKYPWVVAGSGNTGFFVHTSASYSGFVIVVDPAYTDAATFKTAMSGVYLVYELATPTTETAEPYQEVQICSPYGTEEYVTTGIVPVGHNTTYLTRDIFGGTLDLVTGVLTVDRAMVDLGTLDWSYRSTNQFFYASLSGKRPYISVTNYPKIIASIYPFEGNIGIGADTIVDKAIWNRAATDSTDIIIKDTAYSDPTSFKTAMNGAQLCYELATPQTYQLTPHQIQTLVGQNNVWSDAGNVDVTFNLPITNLLVKRQDTSDTSGKWLTLYSQPITQASDMDFTYIDFLNQHGKTYRYALVPLLTQQQGDIDVEIEGGYTVSDDVLSVFDGVFVANSNGSQKLKAATEYGDLETNQDVGVLTTIGGKYPFVVSNSNLNYHSGSISALIVPSDFYTSGDLGRLDIVERREAIEQFLTDKTAKVLKDWNGNIWLITFVENVEVSFVDDYGMGLGTLSAKWVEIGDVNDQTDLQQTGLI